MFSRAWHQLQVYFARLALITSFREPCTVKFRIENLYKKFSVRVRVFLNTQIMVILCFEDDDKTPKTHTQPLFYS